MKEVYLAGPISGLNYAGATDWRKYARDVLGAAGINGRDPMRCKDYLAGMENLDKNCVEYGHLNVLSSPRGIMTRDRFDATSCDVLLVNFVGASIVSMGTIMEIAWADLCRTPIVCAMEPGNIHEHAMVNEAIGFRVNTLEEALQITIGILS